MAEYIDRGKAIESLPVAWDSAINALRNAPSADFAPVVHGRWIEKQEKDTFAGYLYSYECSECGRVEQRKEPYCPKCGAKMGDKLYG